MLSMSWKNDLIQIIKNNHLDLGIFTLEELYRVSFNVLSRRYPNNNTIKSTIRRTLQEIRDDGYLIFISRGVYKVNDVSNEEFIHFVLNYHKYQV